MKTLRIALAMAVLSLAAVHNGQAQELGIRFGDALANKSSVAIDGVFALGKFSRIHADVAFGNGVAVEALWDFLYRPIPDSPVNWYVGVGPALYLSSPFALGASGEVGVEYRFKEVPIAIGLDYRPTFVLIETTAFVNSFGLNVRYVFR
ncbi:MAG: outer membrane insertion C- signal [Cyclobacteriaceae bacterium]|nr:outer membrane insertion C- signal [Cyclobacteriaceae bacterium]